MKRWLILAMTVLALGLVAGCGGDDDDGGGQAATTEQPADTGTTTEEAPAGGGVQLTLAADASGNLAFDKTELSATAGTVTITMTNASDVPHNIALEGNGVDEQGEVVSGGDTSEVTADLQPGEYTFYCAVSGHREAGMEGTLTVQ